MLQRKYLVDIFHNSSTGVRAQCFYDIGLGEEALDHARDMLRARAIELAERRRNGPIPLKVICASLGLDSTKVWIYQGLWARRARLAERHLRIAQWQAHENSECRTIRDLVRFGSKAPNEPAAVNLIGGWWHPSVEVAGKSSALRARQIHNYGFT